MSTIKEYVAARKAAIAEEIRKEGGDLAPLYVAWKTITDAEAEVSSATAARDEAKSAYQQAASQDNSALYNARKQAVDSAQRSLFTAYNNYRWAVEYGIAN